MAKIATSAATWTSVFITNDHILLLSELLPYMPKNKTHMTWKEVHKRSFRCQHQREKTQTLIPHVDADNSRIPNGNIFILYFFKHSEIHNIQSTRLFRFYFFHSRSTLLVKPPPPGHRNPPKKHTTQNCSSMHVRTIYILIRQLTIHIPYVMLISTETASSVDELWWQKQTIKLCILLYT